MTRHEYNRAEMADAIFTLVDSGKTHVTYFLGPPSLKPKTRILATKVGKGKHTDDIRITVGRLNYAERHYVRRLILRPLTRMWIR